MSGPLLALAAALLVWPGPAARRRARLASVAGGRQAVRWGDRLPAAARPLLVGLAVTATAAALTTGLVAVLAGAVAGLALRSWLRRRGQADEERALADLTEALGALAAELRSGRSLAAAGEAAAAGCADPGTGRALARAVTAPPPAGTVPAPGEVAGALDRVAAAVRLSTRTGCSLAAVVGAVEDDLRARRRHTLELRSATAGPRASAALLAMLPLLALAMGGGVGADPWRVLTTTGTGQVLLVAGVVLEGAGLAWTARLVRRAVR